MYFLWKLVFGSLALAFTQHHNKKLSVCSRSMSSPNQGWTGDNDLDQGCSKGDRGRGNFTWCPWQLNLFFFFSFLSQGSWGVSTCSEAVFLFAQAGSCHKDHLITVPAQSFLHSSPRAGHTAKHGGCGSEWTSATAYTGADILVTQSRDANRLVASEMS